MAVRQKHPVPVARRVVDELRRHRGLALPERHGEEAVRDALRLRELLQVRRRVHARGQDEDQRRRRRRVGVRLRQIQRRRLDVFASQRVGDVHRRGFLHAVHSEAPHENHALQLVALALPVPRQTRRRAGVLRLALAVPVLPVHDVLLEVRGDA